MRILAIAQVRHFLKRQPQILRKARRLAQSEVTTHPLQRRSDGGIVGCGRRKCLLRQPPFRFPRERALRASHLFGDAGIIGGRSNHRDILKIFGRRTNHRRPANIDVFYQFLEVHARLGGGFFKGVQIHNHHVDGRNAMLGNRRPMPAVFTAMQNSAVNLRMQRLDAPIQHLRKSRKLGNILHRNTGIAQQLGRASGRNQFHAQLGEFTREINQPGFISDTKNGTLDSRHQALGANGDFNS